MSNEAIQRFVNKIRVASRSSTKTINITTQEAQDVANDLALLLLRESELMKEILALKSAAQITSVIVGGGKFGED